MAEHLTTIDRPLADLVAALMSLTDDARIAALNHTRRALHAISPLRHHPVDLVEWVRAEDVAANDYNPNTVSPPELALLEHSIASDGYTMPVVTWLDDEGHRETVDGFHRGQVGRMSTKVRANTSGWLPVSTINAGRTDRSDRIASTIRHNRARGVHRIDGMSAIVQELTRRKWSDARIGKELGMAPDEVLRLKQITGLAELFADRDFSEAWEPEQ